MDTFTYKKAGVDIAVADAAKAEMKEALADTAPFVLNQVGAFASLIDGRFAGYKHPVLVLKMEEPGSKALLAWQHGKLSSVGYDLINHLLNDIVVMGAKPVCVLDTIVCSKIEKEVVVGLVKAMRDACKKEGCELVGGETSEQPRVLPEGRYILSASALGVVDQPAIIDGKKIKEGDLVVGVASNGFHTNGYSLLRSLLDAHTGLADRLVDGERFIDIVLRPHLGYSSALQKAFAAGEIAGLAHITGGGIPGNLNRVLPANLNAQIDSTKIKILPVFSVVREVGNVPDQDMIQSTNLGVGLVAVLAPERAEAFINLMNREGHTAYPIGSITKGSGDVVMNGRLAW